MVKEKKEKPEVRENIKKILLFLSFCSFIFCELEKKETRLTIYNQNFAVVEEIREGKIKEGKIRISILDIPKFIEPASIQIYPLSFPPDSSIIEQTYIYDIFTPEKLLEKNIGKEIEVITKDKETYSGKLLNFDPKNLIIKSKDKILVLNRENIKEIRTPKTDEFILKPQIDFIIENKIENKKEKIHKILLKYTTKNINWKSDYIAEFDEEKSEIDLTGYITIDNKTGIDYKNSSIKLIAGEVKKLREEIPTVAKAKLFEAEAPALPPVEEKPIFEYYSYILKEKTDIKDGETKQINYLSPKDIKVDKKYVYDGRIQRHYHYAHWRNLPYNEKVEIKIEFKNQNQPLPSGKIRIYKIEEGGSIFIGEDMIGHIPTGEIVKLSCGYAFDVKGERRIIAHERIGSDTYKDTYLIKVKNFKDKDIDVEVIERIYGDWDIIEKTDKFEKIDAYTIRFPIKVKAKGEKTIKYTAITKL